MRSLLPLLALLAACGGDIVVSKIDAVDADSDGYDETVDCDDGRNDVNPTAPEICDGRDNDCDGLVDDDAVDAQVWYADADEDGYGDANAPQTACDQPEGTVQDATDCDDDDTDVHPDADEICDGIDDDCDGPIDDDDDSLTGEIPTFYVDTDEDGYGDPDAPSTACDQPASSVLDATDCDDADTDVHPDADEICDGIDDDCDGLIDDDDDSLDPSSTATWTYDTDADGYGDADSVQTGCSPPDDAVSDATDCDDTNTDVHPDADEICDGIDDDCDGLIDDDDDSLIGDLSTYYADVDSDDFGDAGAALDACTAPDGYVTDDTDCDDGDDTVYPGAADTCGDGVDADCDGADACLVDGDYTDSDAFARVDDTVASRGFASDLTPLGDINGDGQDDVLLVSKYDSDTLTYQGGAFVFEGPLSGDYTVDDANATLWGAAEGDTLDFTTRAGDLDGDGYDDVVVGSQLAEPKGYYYEGGLWVVYGPVSGSMSLSSADARIAGGAEYRMMRITDGLGDIDGDGDTDLAVCTWGHGSSISDYATAFRGPITGDKKLTDASITIHGASSDDGMGELAGGEDIDGDGVADYVLGTPYNDAGAFGGGALYVVFGPLSSGTISSLYDRRYTGDASNEWFGSTVQVIPDMDGDGYAEVLGTSYFEYSASLVYGGTLPASGNISSTADAVFTSSTSTYAGRDGAPRDAGDLDADGDHELIVSDGAISISGSNRGVIGVFDAPTGTLTPSDADLRFTGDADDDYMRRGRAAGDMDGDGLADIMVSVTGDDAGGSAAGAVWFFAPR